LDNAFTALVLPMIGVLIVIAAAYFGTGWLAKKYAGVQTGRYLRVNERLSLGQDKSLVLVRAGGKALMLGVSSKGFEVLKELDGEEIPEARPEPAQKYDFSAILAAAMKANPFAGKLHKLSGDKEERQ
jgi:flagellar biosynthetic protein FliO